MQLNNLLLLGGGAHISGAAGELPEAVVEPNPDFRFWKVTAAGYMRYMRSSMLDVKNQDYMRTARANGLNERTVNMRHGLRNALIPLVTLLAFEIPVLFGGALYTETIFSWPGMGRLFYERAVKGDIPMTMALVLIFSALTIIAMFLADIAYTMLDPRIKLDKIRT